jgi:hypothetical protein
VRARREFQHCYRYALSEGQAHVIGSGSGTGTHVYDVSRARSAARASCRSFSICVVSGCAPPNTRRAIRSKSSKVATAYGHYDCVRLLLRWGAKVNVRMSGGATPLFLAVEKGPAAVARLLLRWGADPEIPREDGETVFTAHFESLVDARALLAENYLSAGAPFDYDPDDAERLEREQAPFRPFPPLWVRFLRVVAAATVVVLIQADWTQRKLRDYFLRPLARITNRMSPRGYQTYDWEE